MKPPPPAVVVHFATDDVFKGIIEKTQTEDGTSVKELLSYDYQGIKSTIREGYYFIFKAIFDPYHHELKENLRPNIDLPWLCATIDELIQSPSSKILDRISQIDVFGQPLDTLVYTIKNLTFCREILPNLSNDKTIEELSREYHEFFKNLKSKEFVQSIDKSIAETKNAFKGNAIRYKRTMDLWDDIDNRISIFCSRLNGKNLSKENIVKSYAVLRFSFPEISYQKLTEWLEDILSQNDPRINEAKIDIITIYLRCIAKHDKDGSYEHLSLLLWVLDLHSWIEALKTCITEPNYSLKLLFTASDIQRTPSKKTVKDEIRALQIEFDEKIDPSVKPKYAMGLAYLYFHRWYGIGFRPSWRPFINIQPLESINEGKILIEKSIELAKFAYEGISGDPLKKVYALNQYVYYLVEGGPDESLDEIKKSASELVSCITDSNLWQYRYDDTIARYFHRLASTASSLDDWRRWTDNALSYITRAEKEAITFGDDDVSRYKGEIEVFESLGWHQSKSS